MKVSLKWLRDYVHIPLPLKELAEKLTMSGTEVKGIETVGKAWENIDFDASAVTLGEESVVEVGERLFHHLLRVLSGELTKCEVFADEEFAISRLGESL